MRVDSAQQFNRLRVFGAGRSKAASDIEALYQYDKNRSKKVSRILLVVLLILPFCQVSQAEGYAYEAISQRYSDVKLDVKEVKRAKMEGECLVGLKELNFKKQEEFDPVAEWTNYRSFSLLEQYSPCSVLIIMEVAKSRLNNGEVKK